VWEYSIIGKPQTVVVELWDERYNDHYDRIMKHPRFDAIMDKFYGVLDDEEKFRKLGEKSDLIELKEMEYLIGIDICSFRIPRWRSILGDRSWSVTQKRLRAKMRLSDLLDLDQEAQKQNAILTKKAKEEVNDELDKIKQALSTTDDDEEFDFYKLKQSEIEDDRKSDDQCYQEVVIDEVNTVILKNIQKWEGSVVNVLMKNERIPSFQKLWKDTYDDYYKDIEIKNRLEDIKAKRLLKRLAQET
jgi:hypothetical protein